MFIVLSQEYIFIATLCHFITLYYTKQDIDFGVKIGKIN